MKAKIPATVLTGFLGAGKTTMIRHLLANANGKRIALIINEFGDLGIDAEIVKGCAIEGCAEEDVVELANGCICCAVADDFIPTMEKLLARPNPPDHIVIETSGLALPKPLVKAFNWPEVKSRVTVSGVIAVVDAPAVAAGRFEDEPRADDVPHDNPLEEVFEDQLLCADLVVLNKCDQIDHEALSAVRQIVAESLRPGVKAIPATRGAIDLGVLLGLDAEAENDVERRRSHHDLEDDHDHEDFESFVVPLPADVDPAALEIRIRRAAGDHDILRVKGFVAVAGKEMRHVIQGVGSRIERYFDRPWGDTEDRAGRLVVIGKAGLDRAAIARALTG